MPEKNIIPHAHIHHSESQICLLPSLVNQSSTTTSPEGRTETPKILQESQHQAGRVRQRKVLLSKHSLRGRSIPAPGLWKTSMVVALTWSTHQHDQQLCTWERILRAELELTVPTRKGTAPAPAKQSDLVVLVQKSTKVICVQGKTWEKSINFSNFIQNQNLMREFIYIYKKHMALQKKNAIAVYGHNSHGISLKLLQ